ncbi:MAG TPA: aminotransferase class IV [Actinomycetota bacterium]|nr:aminotransferase class IV [Actinomycetota bacterium]
MATVWLNGKLLDESDAWIPALDRGVLWGYGLFETLRAYSARLWAFNEHHARMQRGAESLDIPIPTADVVAQAMQQVIEANNLADCGVRVTVTRGTGPVDPNGEVAESGSTLVTAWPIGDYSRLYEDGAALITLPGWCRSMPDVKSTSYAVSVAGRTAASRAGADDAVFVDSGGRVLEATASNLMAIRDGCLVTPPLDSGVLPGVTRQALLDVAQAEGLRTREEDLIIGSLQSSEEVILTSTLREVYPVSAIDGTPLRRGPMAERLRRSLREEILSRLGL